MSWLLNSHRRDCLPVIGMIVKHCEWLNCWTVTGAAIQQLLVRLFDSGNDTIVQQPSAWLFNNYLHDCSTVGLARLFSSYWHNHLTLIYVFYLEKIVQQADLLLKNVPCTSNMAYDSWDSSNSKREKQKNNTFDIKVWYKRSKTSITQ